VIFFFTLLYFNALKCSGYCLCAARFSINRRGNVRNNVVLRRVRVAIDVVEKKYECVSLFLLWFSDMQIGSFVRRIVLVM